MYQIDNSSAAAVIPASTSIGTPGFFTDGNPATGIAPTILPAEFMNMVMMELLGVLSAAGVTPSKSNFTQLVTAIKAVNKQTTILADTGTAGAYSAVNVPALTALPATGFVQRVNIAHENPGASTYAPDGLTPKPIYGLGLQSLQGGELPVGVAVLMYLVQAGVNGESGAWIIIESLGGSQQIAAATKSQQAMQLGQAVGRLIGVQIFTANGTYTSTSGTTSIIAELVGGGGGGGGVASTTAGQSALSSGGGAGAYAKGRFTTGFAGASVLVGSAGSAGTSGANAGGNGGASGIGALISAPGGLGGIAGAAASNSGAFVTGGSGVSPSSSGANIVGCQGQASVSAVLINASVLLTSTGGGGPLGIGGPAPATPGAKSGSGFGSGASGNYNLASSAAQAGAAGQPGIVIIYEYA